MLGESVKRLELLDLAVAAEPDADAIGLNFLGRDALYGIAVCHSFQNRLVSAEKPVPVENFQDGAAQLEHF